jgi:hypothetical protein
MTAGTMIVGYDEQGPIEVEWIGAAPVGDTVIPGLEQADKVVGIGGIKWEG